LVIVSACLVGLCTRYDGRVDAVLPEVTSLGGDIVPVCPEQLGGLPTPRPPSSICGGDGKTVLAGRCRLLNDRGEDTTDNYLRGARATLEVARLVGATRALLRENSPSCGVAFTNADWKCVPGSGVTAALLEEAGLEVTGVSP